MLFALGQLLRQPSGANIYWLDRFRAANSTALQDLVLVMPLLCRREGRTARVHHLRWLPDLYVGQAR